MRSNKVHSVPTALIFWTLVTTLFQPSKEAYLYSLVALFKAQQFYLRLDLQIRDGVLSRYFLSGIGFELPGLSNAHYSN